jgi:hypothetical protein
MSAEIKRLIERRREFAEQVATERSRIEDLYQRVFNNEDGRWVLIDILNDLGMWSREVESVEEVATQNYARLLLEKCGAWQAQRLPDIIASLLGGNAPTPIEVERSDNG